MKNEEKENITFTNGNGNIIIKKKHNPLKMNYKLIREREGLYMKKTKDIFNEVTKELNWKEKIIVRLFTKTFIKVYDIIRVNMTNKLLK